MNRRRTIERVEELCGGDDEEVLDVMPARVRYEGGELTVRGSCGSLEVAAARH